MDDGRFEILLDRYQRAETTRAEVGELEQLLRDSAERRAILVEHSLLEVHLTKVLGNAGYVDIGTRPFASRASLRLFRRTGGWAVAAGLALGVGISLFWMLGGSGRRPSEVVSGQVSIDGVAATQVRDGASFEVTGTRPARIRLPDGSVAELAPTSQGEIQGRDGQAREVFRLIRGFGKFQVSPGREQFRVDTPVGAVVAVGTAFSVNLRPPPKTGGAKTSDNGNLWMAVAVTEGAVRVTARDKSYQLSIGDNRLFDDDGAQHNIDDGDQNNKDDGDR